VEIKSSVIRWSVYFS